jgi:hypothetical protein
VKTEARSKHLLSQIQIEMRRQAGQELERGMIVQFAHDPLALI